MEISAMSANSHVMERPAQMPEPEPTPPDAASGRQSGPGAAPKQSRMSRWLSHQLGRLLAISASLVSTYVITGAPGLLFLSLIHI